MPPKKQITLGIEPADVYCKLDMNLIFKSTDGSPACVKLSTAEKLKERGWTVTEAHKNVTNGETYVSGQVISKSDVSTIPDSPISDGLVLAVALEHMASLLEKPVDVLAGRVL